MKSFMLNKKKQIWDQNYLTFVLEFDKSFIFEKNIIFEINTLEFVKMQNFTYNKTFCLGPKMPYFGTLGPEFKNFII